MVFSSLFFIFAFLPLCIFIYYQFKSRRLKNLVLIIFSLFFYAWGEPVWVTLLLFSATIDYFHGLIIDKYPRAWQAKVAVVSSLVLNLGLLIVFKYSGMLVNTFYAFLGFESSYVGFTLPIGISFYTFQTISYTIDVYRGEVKAQESYLKFLMFVSLFHQLVAGPIVRYKDVAEEIDRRVYKINVFNEGINRFILGLSKKVIIANTAGKLLGDFMDSPLNQASLLGSWFGIFLFAIQIYFDFSGYSDMAIGLGKMFGFNYKENFNYPYISKSATEFWRRWHMSLGSFFRDYLYIPLGGNRSHMYRNLIIVWFLTGLWHGASWNFVVWGLYYGFLILIEKILANMRLRMPAILGHIYLLVACLVGWVFFYFTSLSDGISYLSRMFGLSGLPLTNIKLEVVFMNNLYFIILAILLSTPLVNNIYKKISSKLEITQILVNLVLFFVSIAFLVGETYNPFLYFRF